MSGSIEGSLLTTLYSASSSVTSGLLSAIYGTGTTSSSATATAALTLAEKNQTTDVALQAKQPATARDIATFRSKVAAATDAKTLLQDPTVLKVLLTASGLSSQTGYAALAQKALLSDTTSSTALANTLSNTNWASTAKLYDFANKGLSVIQNSKVIDTIADGYAEVVWRQSLDATTPGLSNALTFRANASTITSVDQILGDSTLRTVVTTALNIPKEIAYQPLDAQEKAITNRLDITKFSDPKFVEQFTQRYLIAANASSTSSSTSLYQLAVSAAGLTV